MSENSAISKFKEATEAGNASSICVPASLDFILPEKLLIPKSTYDEAIMNDGLYVKDVLTRLESQQLIKFAI